MKVQIDRDLEDLVPDYLENRRLELIDLKKLIEQKDLAKIKTIGHKLAGNAGGYGFHTLGTIGSKIEKAAIANNLSEMSQFASEIEDFLKKIEIEYI
jgi:HPt (histidine-containing phosphotransfer) domain-containing protein